MRWRTFLEPANRHVDSYVTVDIDDDDGYVDLKIADCSNTVHLSFGRISSKTSYKYKRIYLKKLERLEKALALIREAIE